MYGHFRVSEKWSYLTYFMPLSSCFKKNLLNLLFRAFPNKKDNESSENCMNKGFIL